MPIQLPNLDDRTYPDLVNEALALIPTLDPDWTNYNATDPGITLVEMFAYLSEMLIFRLNRVTDDHLLAFLKLLRGPDWTPGSDLVAATRETVLALRKANRAITAADFENLAKEADPRVVRARCVPNRNLASENSLARANPKPGHISVVIVPQAESANSRPTPDAGLIQTVHDYLEPLRLLTTQLHIVGPRYYTVTVKITMGIKADAVPDDVTNRVVARLQQFLHPVSGGENNQGWPFGRNVFASEIYAQLDQLPGVDFISKVEFGVADAARLVKNDQGDIYAVAIQADELVDASVDKTDVTIQTKGV